MTHDTITNLEAYAKEKGYNKSTIVKLALDQFFLERASEKWQKKTLWLGAFESIGY